MSAVQRPVCSTVALQMHETNAVTGYFAKHQSWDAAAQAFARHLGCSKTGAVLHLYLQASCFAGPVRLLQIRLERTLKERQALPRLGVVQPPLQRIVRRCADLHGIMRQTQPKHAFTLLQGAHTRQNRCAPLGHRRMLPEEAVAAASPSADKAAQPAQPPHQMLLV